MYWLVLYTSMVPHQVHLASLPVLEPTLHKHVLPPLRKPRSNLSIFSGILSSMCELSHLRHVTSFAFLCPVNWATLLTPFFLLPPVQGPPLHLRSGALRGILYLHHLPLLLPSVFGFCFINVFPFS